MAKKKSAPVAKAKKTAAPAPKKAKSVAKSAAPTLAQKIMETAKSLILKPQETPAKAPTAKVAKVKAEKAPAPKVVDAIEPKKTAAQKKLVEKAKTAPAVKVSMTNATPKPEEKPVKISKAAAKANAATLERLAQAGQKWQAYYKKSAAVKPKPYNMRGTFEAKTPIVHKVLGWGYILANKNDRLEVLFQDGVRFLISNYKA